MRRCVVGALMMSLLCLTACGGGTGEMSGEELALQIRSEWLDMTGCVCHVDLTADYGERVFDCGLDVTWDRVTGGTLTVTQPELVAGLTARFSGKDVTLTYDGVSLETGPLTDEGISPLEAVPGFYKALTEGYMAVCDLDEETLQVTFRDYQSAPGEGLETTITFDAQTHVPQTGTLYWDGAAVLTAQVTGFQMMMTGAQ